MKQKINTFLNLIMGLSLGVFFGYGLYVLWAYKKYPDLYAMQSAPWYTGILFYGIVTITLLAAAALIKWILRKNWFNAKRKTNL